MLVVEYWLLNECCVIGCFHIGHLDLVIGHFIRRVWSEIIICKLEKF